MKEKPINPWHGDPNLQSLPQKEKYFAKCDCSFVAHTLEDMYRHDKDKNVKHTMKGMAHWEIMPV
jgi:hypothetical protein